MCDRLVNRTLRKLGWRVMRIWELVLARKAQADLVRRRLARYGVVAGRSGAAPISLLVRHATT